MHAHGESWESNINIRVNRLPVDHRYLTGIIEIGAVNALDTLNGISYSDSNTIAGTAKVYIEIGHGH
jgi:hypothetical protein